MRWGRTTSYGIVSSVIDAYKDGGFCFISYNANELFIFFGWIGLFFSLFSCVNSTWEGITSIRRAVGSLECIAFVSRLIKLVLFCSKSSAFIFLLISWEFWGESKIWIFGLLGYELGWFETNDDVWAIRNS